MLNEDMLSLGSKASVIREIFEYSNARKAMIGEENVFDFSLGNPSIPAPSKVNKTITSLIETYPSVKLHGYTSATGDIKVRQKIARSINERYEAPFDARLIYMTCGAAASLTITLKALISPKRGDEVIVLAPYFPEYSVFIENAGARCIEVKCRPDDFGIDVPALKAAIGKNTRAVIVNSPNNPTGAVYGADDIKALCRVLSEAEERFKNTIYILADEPYREIVYDGTDVPYIPNYYKNTIVCYSYSKSLSLAGERIGYIAVSPEAESADDIFSAVCGAGRSMGYVCAPSLMQKVLLTCCEETPDIDKYDKNRKLLYDSLIKIGYEAVHPSGAFYLFVKTLEDDANAFCERAKKHELLLVPSDTFGIKGYVRISYCVDYDMIKRSIAAFEKLYDDYGTDLTRGKTNE